MARKGDNPTVSAKTTARKGEGECCVCVTLVVDDIRESQHARSKTGINGWVDVFSAADSVARISLFVGCGIDKPVVTKGKIT